MTNVDHATLVAKFAAIGIADAAIRRAEVVSGPAFVAHRVFEFAPPVSLPDAIASVGSLTLARALLLETTHGTTAAIRLDGGERPAWILRSA